jgi:endo-1,4-beta-xylanase
MKDKNLSRKGLLIVSVFAFIFCGTQLSQAAGGSGYDHGVWWSWWANGGNCSLTFPYAGQYAGNSLMKWSGAPDALGGKGWSTGGYRTVGYNCSLQNCNSFGVYGWTHAPVIEYYITDIGAHNGQYIGTVYSDGGTYNVYKTYCANGASIEGTMNYWQYKSDRQSDQSQNQNHTITTGNHFNYYITHIGSMGSFTHEMKVQGECWTGATGYSGSTIW